MYVSNEALIALFVAIMLFVLYFVVLPAATYVHYEARHRHRWRRRWLVERPEASPGGPFREPTEATEHGPSRYLVERRGAPWLVKLVAVVSLVLGHMTLPGLLAGLYGLLFYGVGLVSIPGLVLAVGIYRNAFGLLRCEPAAATRARALRAFAVALNVVVLFIVAVMELAWGMHPLTTFTAVYACISLLHAAGLGMAADAIEAAHDPVLEVVAEPEQPLLLHGVVPRAVSQGAPVAP